MTSLVDLDQYWGVQLAAMHYDCRAMSIAFDLYWTVDGSPCRASLLFSGVSECRFTAEKTFNSEVVELVSIEREKVPEGWRCFGELSNYDFTLTCIEVTENRH